VFQAANVAVGVVAEQITERRSKVKRLVAAGVIVGALFVAPSATATIHPLTVGWWCGNASGDPPGQTPPEESGVNHSAQSTFRALQATGVVTFTGGEPAFNPDLPPAKFSTFDVATETGTPSNPGALNCAGAPAP
jgi:hypothetical protein